MPSLPTKPSQAGGGSGPRSRCPSGPAWAQGPSPLSAGSACRWTRRVDVPCRRTGRTAAWVGSVAVTTLVVRRLLRWGATVDEARRAMPGDDEVPNAHLQGTRAVTVEATPAQVWPWIAQIGYHGYGRAGWYAFDLADNDGVPSSWEIIPGYQHPRIGQVVGEEGFTVRAIEPDRLLLLSYHWPRTTWVVKQGLWPQIRPLQLGVPAPPRAPRPHPADRAGPVPRRLRRPVPAVLAGVPAGRPAGATGHATRDQDPGRAAGQVPEGRGLPVTAAYRQTNAVATAAATGAISAVSGIRVGSVPVTMTGP